MESLLAPPLDRPDTADGLLRDRGYAVLDHHGLGTLLDIDPAALDALPPFWDRLATDEYLRDGGRYRQRRHGSFVVEHGRAEAVAHRAHWQPVEYNALHGGMQRWFAPLEPAMTALPVWPRLLAMLAARADALRGAQRWFVEAHAVRIDTPDGVGRPTPEGAHRDGVDLVAVLLIARHEVSGGETRVFDANGPHGLRFTMTQPWTTLLIDDDRVIHESTPIQPAGEHPYRDTLVITLRSRGFQGDIV